MGSLTTFNLFFCENSAYLSISQDNSIFKSTSVFCCCSSVFITIPFKAPSHFYDTYFLLIGGDLGGGYGKEHEV